MPLSYVAGVVYGDVAFFIIDHLFTFAACDGVWEVVKTDTDPGKTYGQM